MTARPKKRCSWALGSDLESEYHDREWGRPSRDDPHLFEMLILEGAQAGLSWSTILNKRENYRKLYRGFDPAVVARFDKRKRESLLGNAGIVRNRSKIESSVRNAQIFLEIQREFGSFSAFAWAFVDNRTIVNRPRRYRDAPTETEESRALSRALHQRGMRFVGPTILYAFMQAVGMVDDHEVGCFRKKRKNR